MQATVKQYFNDFEYDVYREVGDVLTRTPERMAELFFAGVMESPVFADAAEETAYNTKLQELKDKKAAELAASKYYTHPATHPISMIAGDFTPDRASFLKKTQNLFNYSEATDGKFLSNTNTEGAHADHGYTGFIPVEEGKTYVGSDGKQNYPMRFTTYFDADKAYVAGGSSVGVKTLTVPAGVAYVRVTYYAANKNTFQLEEGTAATAYAPFGWSMGTNTFPLVPVPQRTTWYGKAFSTFGDSMSGNGSTGWQKLISNELGMVYYSYAQSGTRVARKDMVNADTVSMCTDERINAIYDKSDLITFMGGTNDWAQSIPLGTISDDAATPTTFYAAVKAVAQKLYARFPTKRIVFFAPPFGQLANFADFTDPVGILNNQGLSLADYGTAIREVARMHGIPFVDTHAGCGWNTWNYTTYVPDGLHPTAIGYKRIAQHAMSVVNTVQTD